MQHRGELWLELEAAGSAATAPSPPDATDLRLELLERRVEELAATVAQLVALLAQDPAERR